MGAIESGQDVVARDEGSDSEASAQDVIDEDTASDVLDASDDRVDASALDAGDSAPDVLRDGALDVRESGVDAGRDASDAALDASCPAGQTMCSTGCTDTRSNVLHCGGCERPCATSALGFATCEMGFCALRCNPGFRYSEPGGVPTCVADTLTSADSCPGQTLDVMADRSVTVVGTTVSRGSARIGTAPCNALTGPEVYYQVIARAEGTLRVTLTSFEPLGVYALSGACADGAPAMQVACSYQPSTAIPRGRIQTFVLNASMGQVFTIVVDTPTATGQAFALTVAHESNCGPSTDTIPAGTRTCGDRNATAGDGCSETCSVETGVAQTSCPMSGAMITPIAVGTAPIVYEGSWAGGGGTGVCGAAHNRGERFYAVDVATPSDLRIELDPAVQAQVALSVRRAMSCGMSAGEQCANILGDTGTGERIDVSTTVANERLWLIADSDTDTSFELRITPRNCGDSNLGPVEECDDGNNVNGDGCDSMCRVEAVCAVMESADTTLASPLVLPSTCRTVRVTGAINPMGGADLDDAARIFLRAGEVVRYQLASGGQGQCPMGVDPVIEISRGTSASVPMARNNECAMGLPAICRDDAATYCPEGVFAAPADDWYTFRMYRWHDTGGSMPYQLLVNRR